MSSNTSTRPGPLLGVVHRGVGVAQQLLRTFLTGCRQRDPDARTDVHLGAAHDQRADDRREKTLGDLDRLLPRRLARQVLAQHGELVTAEPGDGVAGPDHRLELARHRDEQLVAGVVTQAVVDVLEPVEVEEGDANRRLRPPAPRDRLTEPVEEQQTVRQPGERIVHRLVREPFLERLALDRDRRELREQHEDLAMLVVGQAGLGNEHVERAEHGVAVAGEDGDRPRRVQTVRLERRHDARPNACPSLTSPTNTGFPEMRRRTTEPDDGGDTACRRATRRAGGVGAAPRGRSVAPSPSSSMIAQENRGNWSSSASRS